METSGRKRKLDESIIRKLYHGVPCKDPTRESFLKRLKTYNVFNWSGKPVNPPQCARQGWEIAEKDVLKCVMCHQFLSVTLPSPSKHLPYREACSKIRSRLASAHSKFCLYSTNPLPDSVLEINHLSNMELQDTIQQQLLDFKNIEVLSHITSSKEEVKEIFDWFVETVTVPDVNLSSFILVLTGWQFLKDDMLLQCDYCNRKWSIEPYLIQRNAVEKIDCVKPTVDPVGQHQMWCAWRAEERGWKCRLLQLQQLKESRSREKRSRFNSSVCGSLTDSMRAVRKLLNGTI
ncbi:NIPA-like protein [Daphnia magna]|uniref:NIPA-like protein n=1 Tax=Daphnia magna TaxID=35525 RepID=UPI001E1BC84D|nr:NIPA-like protein [Daphnia magna]